MTTDLTESAPLDAASPAVPPGMTRYWQECTDRFTELFARHVGYEAQKVPMSETELREVIDACNRAVAPLGAVVSDKRWVSYMDVVRWSQSARNIKDMEAFKAVCILNCVTFVWDDMDPRLHDFDVFLPQLRAVCERYYAPDDAAFAYEGARAFVTSDHMFRDSPIKKALCTTSPEQYFRFRVTDVGVDFWMKMSYPIYGQPEFTEHAKTGLAARMTTRGLAIVNDFYSYDREAALGQITNCFRLCDVTDETAFRDFFRARLDDMTEDLTCIAAFDETTRDILFDLVQGNFVWTTRDRRYQAAVNDVNARIQ
ncbi:terpene synthase family protein [Streptomyces sp. NPDC050732]|uniref:terpene synthase family protein n=1 Tax=Streptomyces sp. NPDC050732 TaxID=3154632 RepID=UPI00343FE3A4